MVEVLIMRSILYINIYKQKDIQYTYTVIMIVNLDIQCHDELIHTGAECKIAGHFSLFS